MSQKLNLLEKNFLEYSDYLLNGNSKEFKISENNNVHFKFNAYKDSKWIEANIYDYFFNIYNRSSTYGKTLLYGGHNYKLADKNDPNLKFLVMDFLVPFHYLENKDEKMIELINQYKENKNEFDKTIDFIKNIKGIELKYDYPEHNYEHYMYFLPQKENKKSGLIFFISQKTNSVYVFFSMKIDEKARIQTFRGNSFICLLVQTGYFFENRENIIKSLSKNFNI